MQKMSKKRNRNIYMKAWRAKNGTDRRRRYGLTPEQLSNLLEAHPVCELCAGSFGLKGKNIDHNHTTGIVRGVLCTKCNLGLGYFNDDIELLLKATDYLKRFSKE